MCFQPIHFCKSRHSNNLFPFYIPGIIVFFDENRGTSNFKGIKIRRNVFKFSFSIDPFAIPMINVPSTEKY